MYITGEIFSFRQPVNVEANGFALKLLPAFNYPGGSENRYIFELWMPFYVSGAVSGYQFDIAAGTDAMGQLTVFDTVGGIPTTTLSFSNPLNIAGGIGVTGDFILSVKGIATGSLAVSFSQAVTDGANPITVFGNSFLTLIKIP